jgi:hypothetical protein
MTAPMHNRPEAAGPGGPCRPWRRPVVAATGRAVPDARGTHSRKPIPAHGNTGDDTGRQNRRGVLPREGHVTPNRGSAEVAEWGSLWRHGAPAASGPAAPFPCR